MIRKIQKITIALFCIFMLYLLFVCVNARVYEQSAILQTCQQQVYEGDRSLMENENIGQAGLPDWQKEDILQGSSLNLREDATENSDNKKVIYLTFDDGPSKNTPQILDILKKYDVKATFFVIGNNTEFGKEMYKRIVSEGHGIGNHTYSHKYEIIYSSKEAYIEDTEKLNKLILESTGVKPDIIRFPGGSNNHVCWKYGGRDFMEKLISEMQAKGYDYFDWDVSSTDASRAELGKQEIIDAVIKGVGRRQKAIVLMHDSAQKETTVEALPEIIKKLKDAGYSFKILKKGSYTSHFPQYMRNGHGS
ncbi:MAG: polysaccharide deacetylase [Tepidanaerobacteraceae bacterium]|jgi:peptidoglycan/xylan/chitin deacetylase (PgdA/CDA1 family)|nr:polysaccharide deacetylase [Tepidanaerobacteraceae bacterium]